MLMIAPHVVHRCTSRCTVGRSVGSGKPSPTQERQKYGRRRRRHKWSEMAMFALSLARIPVATTSLSLTATAADVDVSPGVSTASAKRHEHVRAEPNSKPNVFFVMIDDMGWNDIGYQSTDMHAVTPNLNRMAESGVKVCHRRRCCHRPFLMLLHFRSRPNPLRFQCLISVFCFWSALIRCSCRTTTHRTRRTIPLSLPFQPLPRQRLSRLCCLLSHTCCPSFRLPLDFGTPKNRKNRDIRTTPLPGRQTGTQIA
ncbi:unnamed protein product [Ectocarpus sp. 4 AP-2014]